MEQRTWNIEWNNSMSVGIPEIDEDHKRFIFLIDELNRAIVDRMDLNEVKRRLQRLIDDAEKHFAHEEKLFKQWKYPDAEDHADKHVNALKSLQAAMDKFINYDFQSEWIDAGIEVKDILINHLLTEDMKYAEFYRNAPKAHEKQ